MRKRQMGRCVVGERSGCSGRGGSMMRGPSRSAGSAHDAGAVGAVGALPPVRRDAGTPPPPVAGRGAGVKAGWGRRGMRRSLAAALTVVLSGSLLAVAPVGLPLTEGPSEAGAQQADSSPVLHRSTIVEGQSRAFDISGIPSRSAYYLHAGVGGSFTAEASDVTITTNDLHGVAQTVSVGTSGFVGTSGVRAYVGSTSQRIRFAVAALSDNDTDDETFGIRLCTTKTCQGGTILGEWTVTVTEPGTDTTLSGTGSTVTIPGGSAVSVMETTRNSDSRDQRATFKIALAAAPTEDIVIVGKVSTTARNSGDDPTSIARVNSSPSPDEAPSLTGNYVVARFSSMVTVTDPGDPDANPPVPPSQTTRAPTAAELTAEVTLVAFDNADDTPGGTLIGSLDFAVYKDNDLFRGTGSDLDENDDPTFGNAETYTSITVPSVPVRVTDDDEPTRVRLLPASPADNTATEGNTDKAAVLVKLDRALVAGEEVTALLTFGGATLGTNFSLAAASGQTGVAYADSDDGAAGLVTLAGAGVQEGVIEVTALADSDGDNQTLQIGLPPFDQPWRANYHRSNLDGGVCAAHGCPNRPQGDPGQRFQSVTLAEAAAGLTVIEHEDPDARRATEGEAYSYTVRLNTMPSNDVTVTTSIASGGSVEAGATLTFTSSNWPTPQTITVRPADNSTDEPRRTLTVTHAFSGDTTYAALSDVDLTVSVLDDDPTTITMAGVGVRPGGDGANISRIMVEGDATRVDQTLTLTLGRALEAGEYVRVPLRLEAVANGNNPVIEEPTEEDGELDPPDGDGAWPPDRHDRRVVTSDYRGVRASANVAWPPWFNDFVMTATGIGVSYEHSNRYTPNHIGFRYIEFRGVGARTATIVVHAKDGFDDGEIYDEAFAVTFPNDFRVFDEDTDQPLTSSPVDSNLGGGIQAMPAEAEAWFGITDKGVEGIDPSLGQVPADWPLLPPGLTIGDEFRLIYVTEATTAASEIGYAHYNDFVRAEITGNQLKQGGVPDLKPYADHFAAVISTNSSQLAPGGNATNNAKLEASGPDGPIYWVDGAKVADNKADFLDGDWDDETNPTRADGTAATASATGYWTGSEANGQRSDRCNGLTGSDRHLRAGAPNVSYGLLNDNSRGPLGQPTDTTNCQPASNSEQRPLYALSTRPFTVAGGASIETAQAAEGSPITFTVTIPEAAPSGGITVPYTLSDGRGVSADPDRIVAAGASGGTGADYDNDAGTVMIAQGQTSSTFTVNTTGDSIYEGDHYFTVTLGTPTGTDAPIIDPTKGSAIGVITDDDDQPTFQLASATASVGEDDGTVMVTVTKTGATEIASSVYWTTADGTAAHPGDYTADAGYLQFAPGDTSKTITIDIIDDADSESAETFKVQLSQPADATLGSNAEATVTVNDNDGPPSAAVDITMSASDGDANGNAVENGAGTTGYRTITITLGRALTGAETVTVPLTVQGATANVDYTLGLAPATQTGVTLLTSDSHSAQNPAVRFAAGATAAVLRLTPVDNSGRTQPYVVVGYGESGRVPTSAPNGLLGDVTGGPVGIVLVDDETGDIVVPSAFGLLPGSGVDPGDEFRLLFRTSPDFLTDATSTEIGYYDAFVRYALASNGHAAIKPYAGFFKVLASTRSGSGSTGATARFHAGLVTTGEHNDHHDQAGDLWADGSQRSARGATDTGIPVYWLGGVRFANNYADLCDISWSSGSAGVVDGFAQADPRSEDGTQNIPDGSVTNSQRYEPWTGSGNACEAWNHPLGASTVSRGGYSGANNLLHAAAAANSQERPLLGLSPVFKVEQAQSGDITADLSISDSGAVTEGGTLTVTVTLGGAAASALSIPVRVASSPAATAASGDYTLPSPVTVPMGDTSGTLTFTAVDDMVDEDAETLTLEFGALPAGIVAGSTTSVAVTISDNDTAGVTVVEAGGSTTVSEDPSVTDTYTVRLDSQPLTNVVVRATAPAGVQIDGPAAGSSWVSQLDLTFTPSNWGTAQTVTVRGQNDSVVNAGGKRDVTIAQSVHTGDTGGKYTTSTAVANVDVDVTDDDTAGVTVAGGPLTVSEDPSVTDTYTVRLTSEPLNNVIVTAAAPAGAQVSTDGGTTWGSSRDLTFNPSGSGLWSSAQTVHVRGTDDDIDNAGDRRAVSIAHEIMSGNGDGGSYTPSLGIAAVSVTVTDDDTAGVTVVETSGSTTVSENNSTPTDSYTVVLASEPLNDVVVRATVPAGAQISVDGGSSWGSSRDLTFTPSNWETAQTVVVRGVDDDIDNANNRRVVEIGHAITDGDGSRYTSSSPSVAAVSVTVNDDSDAAAVVVVQSGGSTVVPENQSSTDSYTVRLGSEPLNDVIVTASAPAGAQVSTDGGSSWGSSRDLTFNPSGSGIWSAAQTVTVRGTQDIIDNPNDRRDVTVTHSIASGNGDGSRYTTSTPSMPSVSVRVNDDDAKPTGISLTTNRNTAVSEGTVSTVVTVTATVDGSTRFGVAKTVAVSVAASGDTASANFVDMTAVADFDITIPAGALRATGSFTIAPDDDVVDEQDNAVAVTGAVSGDSSVTVNAATPIALTDDDAAPTGITLSRSPTSVAEDGGAQTISVTATVDGATRFGTAQTVSVSVGGHDTAGAVNFAQVSGFSITIPAEAASAQGSFTLTPTNNVWFESDGSASISGSGSVTVSGASVTLTNDDAEPSGVTLSVSPVSLGEGGGAQTVTVTATVNGSTRYGTARTVNVTTAGSGNADAVDYTATSPAAIVLAAGAASNTTTFTITPTDDSVDEFDETVTVSGSGTGVAAVTEASVSLTDDDDTTVSISAPSGAVAENGGTTDVTLTLSRALVSGESVTVPLDVVGATAGSDYTLALHPASQTGVALSTSGSDSVQAPKVTLTGGASAAVVRFTAVDDSTRTQPYALVRYGTGARAPSGSGVDFTAPSDGPVGWVITDDETGDIVVPQSWALAPSGVLGQGEPRFRLVFASSAERDASSTDIADYDAFIRGLLAEGHAAAVPYAGFFTVLGSTSAVHLRDHASVTGSTTMPFYWLGETGDATKRVATDNGQFRGEWISTETPPSQSVPRDESGTVVAVDSDGYFTGSTAAGAKSASPLGSASVTVGYLNHSGSGRAPLGSGQTAPNTATRRFYGLSPVFVRATDPVVSVAATQTSVAEGTALSFTVSADPMPPGPLTVRLWVSENAGRAMVPDAQEGLQTIAFAAGDASKTLTVTTAADSADEADAVVTARVLANAGYTVSGTAASASATVTDNDAMSIVLGGGGQTIDEGRTAQVTVTLGRDLASDEQVSVPLESTGTATVGADWSVACSGDGVACQRPDGQFPVMVFTGSGSGVQKVGTMTFAALADTVHPEADETIDIDQDSLAAPSVSGSAGGVSFTGDAAAITIRSVAPVGDGVEVPANWALIPSGLSGGDSFRLLFVSSTKRDASSSDIAVYNSFVQARAAAGHAALASHSSAFRAVASTAAVDARDNTSTTGTGVPVYWVSGQKVADDYADFYDASWDSCAARDESGGSVALPNLDASLASAIWTGTNDDGTAETAHALGTAMPRVAVLAESCDSRYSASAFPLRFQFTTGIKAKTLNRYLYGLSPVFKVAGTADPQASFAVATASVTESVGTHSVTVSLSPAPTANVTVSYSLSGTAVRGSDYSISGVTSSNGTVVVGPSGSASIPVVITDDSTVENAETIVLTLTGGTGYDVGSTSVHTVTITDNDTAVAAALVVTETGAKTVVSESGDEDRFTVELSRVPSADVTVTVSAPAAATVRVIGSAVHAASATLVFTPQDWNVAQQVAVTGVDDNTVNAGGARTAQVTATAASADADFAGLSASVSVRVADTDAAVSLQVTPAQVQSSVLDGGGTAVLTLAPQNASFLRLGTNDSGGPGHREDGDGDDFVNNGTGAFRPAGLSHFSVSGLSGLSVTSGRLLAKTANANGQPEHRSAEITLSYSGAAITANATVTVTVGEELLRRSLDTGVPADYPTDLSATFEVTAAAATPVTVTLSAPGGDVAEGAGGAAGRKDVTVALGRALSGSETVTVPLVVQGATAGSDYTFGLQPASQVGVALVTSGPHSAQNPAVRFSAGASGAVLRFVPVDNGVRTQPFVTVGAGSSPAPAAGGGATLGAVTGGPFKFMVIDDETGDVVVASSWALAPSGLAAGDDFRLLFRTSTTRDATSADIADYDLFVRDVLASGGHADIVPYAGFFKAFASTRSASGSTGTTARVHVGLASGHAGHFSGANDVWADGSTVPTAGSATGTPVWWLNGAILANNYADLCDQAVASGGGVTAGWDVDDPRSETGSRSIASGVTAGQAHQAWTGSGNACEAYDYPLGGDGSGDVSRAASHGTTWAFLHEAHASRAQQRPMYGMSPVFRIAGTAAVPVADFASASSSAAESAGTRHITVRLVPAPSQNVTVAYALSGTAVRGSDYTISGVTSNNGTVTVGPSGTAVIPVAITDDSTPESAETVVLTLTGGSGYTVGTTASAHTLTVTDNDTAGVPAVSVTAGSAVIEGGNATFTIAASPAPAGAITVRYTVTQNGRFVASGRLGSGKTRSLSGASATITVPTVDDGADEADGSVTVTVTGGFGLGYTVGSPSSASVAVRDDDVPSVQFAAGASDADERSGAHLVRVSLSPVPHTGITVGYTVGGTATRDADFATAGSVSAAAGAAFVDIPVTVIGDSVAEPDETVVLTLVGGAGYGVGPLGTHTVTVADGPAGPPAAVPAVSVAGGPAVIEGASATFTLSASVPAAVSVRYTVAQHGRYLASGQLGTNKTASLSGTRATIRIPTLDDNTDEASGSVTVTLAAGAGYTVGAASSASVAVHDDDRPVARFAARTSTAGEGAGAHHVRVLFSTPPHRDVQLGYSALFSRAPGSATHGADFTVEGGSVLVRAGAAFADIPLGIVDDSIAEGPETLTLKLGIGRHYFLGPRWTRSHTVTITDSGTAATPAADFAVAASTAAESAGTRNVTVRLVPAPAQATTVSYVLSGTAARGSDYTIAGVTSNTGTVTVGTSGTATIPVAIIDDTAAEGDETVILTLAAGSGYTVGTVSPTHTLTVAANDAPVVPQLTVTAGPAAVEGAAATFTVSASPPATGTISVRYTVAQNGQFVASGRLGTGKTASLSGAGAAISIPTLDDSADEADGSVTVTLEAAAGYTVGSPASATVRVRDDDVPEAQFAAASSAAAESAGTRSIAVRLVPAPAQALTVSYALSGTASRGSDYTISGVTSSTGTVTVGPSGTATIPVAITDDSVPESAETVVLTLTGGAGYAVGAVRSHTLTVADNDTAGMPTVTVAAGSAVHEGAAATFTVSASPPAAGAISVRYTVAQNGQYVASGRLGPNKTQTLTGAGATISIPTLDDSVDEADGSVTVTLTAGAGYTVGSPRAATVTVRDDDVPAARFSTAASGADEDAGIQRVRVNLDPVPHRRITVSYALAGDATRGADYTAPGAVTAAAGAAHVDIPVAITDDGAVEGAETVTVTLTGGAGYRVGTPSTHTLTIADDDAPPLPQVAVTAGPDAIEGADAAFTITATAAPAAPVSVRYTVTQNGQYLASGQLGPNKTVSLSGTEATIRIPTLDDNTDEASGSVTVTVTAGAGYTVGAQAAATVAVHDNDRVVARFAARTTAAAESAGTHHVRVLFSTPPHRDVHLGYSALYSTQPGTATRGGHSADYTVEGITVLVRAGATHADIPLGIIDDSLVESPETIALKLNIGRYYFLDLTRRHHTVTITDND